MVYFLSNLSLTHHSHFLVDTLRDYMAQFGPVDACTIMRDPTGRSRGFAFLTFVDPESVEAAVAHKEHVLDGKVVSERKHPRAESADVKYEHRLIRKGPFPGRNICAIKEYLLVACHHL